MKTLTRISIWITSLTLILLGIGLSVQPALAASGFSTQRVANISVYVGQRSLASLISVLPAISISPSELSASHWQEMQRITAPFYAVSAPTRAGSLGLSARQLEARSLEQASAARAAKGVGLISLSATDLGEQSLIKGYALRAIARFSGATPSTGIDLTKLSVEDATDYRWQAIANFYATNPSAGVDLTKLSVADATDYRWKAIANFYATHSSAAVSQTKLSTDELPASHWQEMERITAPSYGQIKWWR